MEAGELLGTRVPFHPPTHTKTKGGEQKYAVIKQIIKKTLPQKPQGLSPVCLILPSLSAYLLVLFLGVWPDVAASDSWFLRPQA